MPRTRRRSDRKFINAQIPATLYQAILTIQTSMSTDFTRAALRAAALIESNSELFKTAVQSEASRLAKSQFLKQLNVARESIREESFDEGYDVGYSEGDHFHVPCSVCGKPMSFSDLDSNWKREKECLYAAFSNWHHANCKS